MQGGGGGGGAAAAARSRAELAAEVGARSELALPRACRPRLLLPRHLPTSNHLRKASALDDPTSGVFWSGSLHTPAVRAFMTPTVVHRTRSNALRKVRFPVRTALYDVHPVENRPRPHTAPKSL